MSRELMEIRPESIGDPPAGGPRGRGRPRTGIGPVVGVRFYPRMQAELEAWIALQPDPKPSRPEAIRRLLSLALRGKRGG